MYSYCETIEPALSQWAEPRCRLVKPQLLQINTRVICTWSWNAILMCICDPSPLQIKYQRARRSYSDLSSLVGRGTSYLVRFTRVRIATYHIHTYRRVTSVTLDWCVGKAVRSGYNVRIHIGQQSVLNSILAEQVIFGRRVRRVYGDDRILLPSIYV